jgi:hypothetical protein
MAIAVLPDGPEGRWERIGRLLVTVAVLAVVGLLVFFLIAEYVF